MRRAEPRSQILPAPKITSAGPVDAEYLKDALKEFRKTKDLGDRAIVQLPPEALFATLDPESNSVAIVMKHIAGNMRSRWRDFLTSDGEKPDRQRDGEFVTDGDTKDSILAAWEAGWKLVFDTVGALKPADLSRIVVIRDEPHTVLQAINRQLTHYAYHVGQIVFLAKHLVSDRWKTLSVPRGKSEEWNAMMREKMK